MPRGLRLKFGDAPLTLQCSTGRFGVMSPEVSLVNTSSGALSLTAAGGTYGYTGRSASMSGSALGAVANFQLVNQGGPTNNQGSVTAPVYTQTLVWTAATGAVDHYQIIRRTNYGSDVDYATVASTQLYYTDPTATNFFSAPNIAQDPGPHGPATGPTTVYDYDVVAVDVGGSRGPKPTQFSFWAYRGGQLSSTATGGSTTTLVDSIKSWSTDQWVGYHVFVTGAGDSIVLSNTATTLTFIPTFPLSSTASGKAYQIGGDYFSGVGDVSFGQAAGSPAFTSTGGSPVAPHEFVLGMTHENNAGTNMGLQRPSGSPASYIYGAEVGAFNYATWNQRPAVSGQATEFAVHHRGPPGDLAGPLTNINSTQIHTYGPSELANTWQSYKVPLSVIQFSSPLGGVTSFNGSITGSTMTVTGISGPGLDNGCWITGTGVPTGTFVQPTPSQTGNGSYGLVGLGIPVTGTVAFSDGKGWGTNWYKGQYKVVGSHANETTYYDDIGFVRA